MKKILLTSFASLVFALMCHHHLLGQSPQENYLQQPIKTHPFDTAKWKTLSAGLDYSEDKKQPQQVRPVDPDKAASFATFMKFLLIGLGIALLIYLIVKMATGEKLFAPKNKKIKPLAGDINLEQIEENLHEAELEDPIRRAAAAGDYALAVRLYYLAVLKELSLKELIKWKKDKTNGEYLRELAGSRLFGTVQEVTLIFERVWYGKTAVQEEDFLQMEAKFKKAIGLI
ncbi:MAG: DUF4129 domain-containing protein [Lewinellaceae bacterium]|nr:DUF4129 domain-containing protein [Saprospiraceae bacterium]MCB9338508.1 DUF4129 domain-containing protein [Lewinellaceae bacterium]